jgi:hypothetical protein
MASTSKIEALAFLLYNNLSVMYEPGKEEIDPQLIRTPVTDADLGVLQFFISFNTQEANRMKKEGGDPGLLQLFERVVLHAGYIKGLLEAEELMPGDIAHLDLNHNEHHLLSSARRRAEDAKKKEIRRYSIILGGGLIGRLALRRYRAKHGQGMADEQIRQDLANKLEALRYPLKVSVEANLDKLLMTDDEDKR